MSKTVIDVDDDLLAAAKKVLGTTTKKATVNAALREVAGRRAREEAFDALASMEFLAELAEPSFESEAWASER